jgi:hypothetical protein
VSRKERVHQLSTLLPALVPLHEDDGCSRVLVHGSNAVLRGRWSWGGPHHRVPLGAAHGPQRRPPTQLELSGVVEDIPSAQPLTGVFPRLLVTASSGSGLLLLGGWGRLTTSAAAVSGPRTVAFCPRIPVCSANK